MSNTYGTQFRITTFGESHGLALGVIIDGCPAGLPIDEQFIQQEARPPQARAVEDHHPAARKRFISDSVGRV